MNSNTHAGRSQGLDEAKEFTRRARKNIGAVISAEDFTDLTVISRSMNMRT